MTHNQAEHLTQRKYFTAYWSMEVVNFVLQVEDYIYIWGIRKREIKKINESDMVLGVIPSKLNDYLIIHTHKNDSKVHKGKVWGTYQRSPTGPHSKTPPKVHVNNASPNDMHLTCIHVPALTSGAPPPMGPPGKVKQEVLMSSTRAADKFTSNGNNPLTTSLVTLVTKSHYRSESKLGMITCQVEKY
ncbi:hypothetical protein L1987_21574 [Smallanthus sonchifolius]|uniref:Uncharacterized protein n=1 Tax=Smallanthus sonchifolius TaxID=185202 RepID=A0ACB9IXW0_9ASTR|nr:hypothetical protein L1987_21574 [Smallanthus sonchifolius]